FMSVRKRLLVLTPRFPYPVVGGDRLRIYNQCKVLSEHFDLTLLSLCESKDELAIDVADDRVFRRVERVYLSKVISYLKVMLSLVTRSPLQVAYYRSSLFKKRVVKEARSHDLVLCHLIRTADYVRDVEILKVLEMTDAISLNYQRVSENEEVKGIRALLYRMERKRVLHYECESFGRFDACSLISVVDKEYLVGSCRESSEKIMVAGNGVAVDKYPFQFCGYDYRSPLRIVFIGAMDTLPNFDAAYWFARKVLPLISEGRAVLFEVVGRISESHAAKLSALDDVIVRATVPEVCEAVKGAHIAVAPMRIGAGIQNKILEYMALGLPCITSSLGLEGISAVPNEHLLVANSPVEYVDSVEVILSDPVATSAMAASARELVETEYTWSKQQAEFVNRIHGLLTK
ncbi:MAG: glycosyltransferase, partial [Halothiobacillaceae bacterium]